MEPGTVLSLLTGAIAALGSAVVYLWRSQVVQHKDTAAQMIEMNNETTKKLDECEEDRQKLWGKIAALWEGLAKHGLVKEEDEDDCDHH